MTYKDNENSLFRYRKGCFYKKIDDSTFTYLCVGPISKFLYTLSGNSEFRDVITPQLKALAELLSKDDYHGIPQMKIDYNLIEVTYFIA